MKAILIDDDERFWRIFEEALLEETERAGFPIGLICRRDAEDLGQEADIYFVDIELEKKSGIELAARVQKRNPGREIIFVSAHDRYMQKSMLVRPRFFICKAKLTEDMRDVVMFLKQQWQRKHVGIKVAWKGGEAEVFPQRIVWCESHGHYVDMHLDDGGRAVLRISLRQLGALFSEFHYIRIHNRRMVNLEYVGRFVGNQVVLRDGTALGVSRACQKEVARGIREWFEALYQQS